MSPHLQKILQEIDQLTPVEQMEVMGYLAERAKHYVAPATTKSTRKWSDLQEMVSHPMMGEDAQVWVSRTRQQGDEYREMLLRRGR